MYQGHGLGAEYQEEAEPWQIHSAVPATMPDGNRSNRPEAIVAASFCALAVLGVIVLLYVLGNLKGREAERRVQTPASYSQAAEADAQSACAGRQGAALFDCVYERVEASQEQARGEQDLSAQQRAASAALASAIIALLTLAVTGIGVWFVKRTLDATLVAVRDTSIATKAMERQNELAANAQRPWLDFQMEIVSGIDFSDSTLFLKVIVLNHSGFPAHDVRAAAVGFFHRRGLLGAMAAPLDRGLLDVNLKRKGVGGTAFPHQPFECPAIVEMEDPQEALLSSDSPPARVLIGIQYRYEGGVGFTSKVYRVYGAHDVIMAAHSPPSPDSHGEVRMPKADAQVDPATVIAS